MGIVFLGPPGVGKGTQAQRVSTHLGAVHISTGDILRQAVREKSEVGKKVEQVLAEGQLVGDDLMVEIVQERLSKPDAQGRFLLDGFPRTIAQAEALNVFLTRNGRPLPFAVLLNADSEEIARRLLARANQEGRSDDTPQTVAKRLEVYRNQTKPVVEYYEQRGRLVRVDGMGTMDEVFTRLCRELDALQPSDSEDVSSPH